MSPLCLAKCRSPSGSGVPFSQRDFLEPLSAKSQPPALPLLVFRPVPAITPAVGHSYSSFLLIQRAWAPPAWRRGVGSSAVPPPRPPPLPGASQVHDAQRCPRASWWPGKGGWETRACLGGGGPEGKMPGWLLVGGGWALRTQQDAAEGREAGRKKSSFSAEVEGERTEYTRCPWGRAQPGRLPSAWPISALRAFGARFPRSSPPCSPHPRYHSFHPSPRSPGVHEHTHTHTVRGAASLTWPITPGRFDLGSG